MTVPRVRFSARTQASHDSGERVPAFVTACAAVTQLRSNLGKSSWLRLEVALFILVIEKLAHPTSTTTTQRCGLCWRKPSLA